MDTIRWYNDVFKQLMELKLTLGRQDPGVTVQPPVAKDGASQVDVLFSKAGTRFDGSIFSDAYQPNPTLAQPRFSGMSLVLGDQHVGKLGPGRDEDVRRRGRTLKRAGIDRDRSLCGGRLIPERSAIC